MEDDRSDLTAAHLTMYLDGWAVEFTYDTHTESPTCPPRSRPKASTGCA